MSLTVVSDGRKNHRCYPAYAIRTWTTSRIFPDFVGVDAERFEEFLVGVRFELFELSMPVVHVVVGEAGGTHDFYPTIFLEHVILQGF